MYKLQALPQGKVRRAENLKIEIEEIEIEKKRVLGRAENGKTQVRKQSDSAERGAADQKKKSREKEEEKDLPFPLFL